MNLRVVIVHNRYRSANPSGENRVVEADIERLRADGVDVHTYIRDSDEIEHWSVMKKAGLAIRPTYSLEDVRRFRALLRDVKPQIVHLHNPFPIISPAIIRVAKSEGAAVVQTVHNFRHTCVNGIQFRAGGLCTDCVGRTVPWPAVRHGCYRDSRLATIPMALAQVAHRSTWKTVDCFYPVGEGVADGLRDLGIPEDRIQLRPNIVADPGEPVPLGSGVLYVGRLSEEKGIRLLLAAWEKSGLGATTTLSIAGSGDLQELVEQAASVDHSIQYLGYLSQSELGRAYRESSLVVVPSLWAEADGLVAAVAMAHGRPVLAASIGAMRDYIDITNGWLAIPNPDGMASALERVLRDPDELRRRSDGARQKYLATRSPAVSKSLSESYESVLTK